MSLLFHEIASDLNGAKELYGVPLLPRPSYPGLPLAPWQPGRRYDCSILRRNNRSGLAGVSFHAEVIETGKGPVERRFWIARLPLEPWRTKLVKFSVAKYGAEEAFRRAVKARLDALEALAGHFSPNSPQQQ